MEFLIFGTIWFWLLFVGTLGLIVYFLESALSENNDTGGGFKATLTVAGFMLLYYFCGSKGHIMTIFQYVKTHATFILMLFLVYLLVGAIWSMIKWYFFVLNKRDVFREEIKRYSNTDINDYIPVAKKNKARITSWMTYWPLSGLWTLINDPVRRAFQLVYRHIETFFDKISERMFADDKKVYEEEMIKKNETAITRKGKQ